MAYNVNPGCLGDISRRRALSELSTRRLSNVTPIHVTGHTLGCRLHEHPHSRPRGGTRFPQVPQFPRLISHPAKTFGATWAEVYSSCVSVTLFLGKENRGLAWRNEDRLARRSGDRPCLGAGLERADHIGGCKNRQARKDGFAEILGRGRQRPLFLPDTALHDGRTTCSWGPQSAGGGLRKQYRIYYPAFCALSGAGPRDAPTAGLPSELCCHRLFQS
jgi:hypothetical protein